MRLFAMLRERAGAREVTLSLPDGAKVSDALAELGTIAEGLPLVMAVNREYADEDHVLDPGDELALIPPVSGGEAAGSSSAGHPAPRPDAELDLRSRVNVRVTSEPLLLDSLV